MNMTIKKEPSGYVPEGCRFIPVKVCYFAFRQHAIMNTNVVDPALDERDHVAAAPKGARFVNEDDGLYMSLSAYHFLFHRIENAYHLVYFPILHAIVFQSKDRVQVSPLEIILADIKT